MNCPNCQSDNWKLASLAHAQGLTNVETSTSGSTLGVGVGAGGLGAGYARSSSDTSGSHQTAFSQSAAPPMVPPPPGPKLSEKTKSNMVGTLQILGIGLFLFMLFKESVLIGIIGLALVVIFWGKGKGKLSSLHKEEYKEYEKKYAKEIEEYEAAVAEHAKWERTRICQRCGTRFAPDAGG